MLICPVKNVDDFGIFFFLLLLYACREVMVLVCNIYRCTATSGIWEQRSLLKSGAVDIFWNIQITRTVSKVHVARRGLTHGEAVDGGGSPEYQRAILFSNFGMLYILKYVYLVLHMIFRVIVQAFFNFLISHHNYPWNGPV